MFTYRDFEMGTLGLAWTGDLKNAGGVCEKNGVSWRGSIKNGYEPFRVINSKGRPSIEPSIEPSLLIAVTHSVWPSVIIATSSTSIPGEMNRK